MSERKIADFIYEDGKKKHKKKYIDKVIDEYFEHFGDRPATILQPLPDFLFAIVLKKCIEKDITYEKMFGLEGKTI